MLKANTGTHISSDAENRLTDYVRCLSYVWRFMVSEAACQPDAAHLLLSTRSTRNELLRREEYSDWEL